MEARAKELIEMIAMPQLLPLAIKYAGNLGRIHLAEKLTELQPRINDQEKEKVCYEENEEATEILLDSNLLKSEQSNRLSHQIIPVSVNSLKIRNSDIK